MNLNCQNCEVYYRLASDGTTEYLRTEKRSQFGPALSEWVPMPDQLFSLNFSYVTTLEGNHDRWCRCCILQLACFDSYGELREKILF